MKLSNNAMMFLLLMLLNYCSCRALREGDKANSRKEDCSRFIYCPATIVLFRGDTIRGRFTVAYGTFYQVHENNDSNINRTGNENARQGDYYPVSTWFKRFTPEEISTYTVNGNTYESVIQVLDKNGEERPWKSSSIFFLQRLTPDSSQIQLYAGFTPRSHGETNDGLSEVLGDIALDFFYTGYYTYYIHFPGETSRKIWAADVSSVGKATKIKMAGLFSTCPELQSLAEQIKESPAGKNLMHAMLSNEALKWQNRIPAMITILRKYDECCYRNKK